MKVIVIVLLAAAVASAIATPVPYTNCGSGSDLLTLSSVDATPYPPVPGQNLTVTIAGSLSAEITGGTYQLTVGIFGITIFKKSGDFCTLSPKFPCPQQAGPVSLNDTVDLPSIVPAGTYSIEISGTTTAGQQIVCVQLTVTISESADVEEEEEEEFVPEPKTMLDDAVAPATRDDIIDFVNLNPASTWVAGHSRRFQGLKRKDAKRLCGAFFSRTLPKMPVVTDPEILAGIPTSFDARTAWPKCTSIGTIRDQGSCGSCWAVSAAEAMTDRVCIGSNATNTPTLASEDPLSCCVLCGDGCNGGYPDSAWDYFVQHGLVTGGAYNSNQGCLPYEVPACDHHVVGKLPPCGAEVATPACTSSCEASYNVSWADDKHKGTSAYDVPSDVASIQTEIMNYGPVQAAFSVYEDFVTYKSGVYQHTTGDFLGGHAVKILGWGVENNVPYWLVANSWNTDWGNQGYFKILRGSDECGIEDSIVAGRAH